MHSINKLAVFSRVGILSLKPNPYQPLQLASAAISLSSITSPCPLPTPRRCLWRAFLNQMATTRSLFTGVCVRVLLSEEGG